MKTLSFLSIFLLVSIFNGYSQHKISTDINPRYFNATDLNGNQVDTIICQEMDTSNVFTWVNVSMEIAIYNSEGLISDYIGCYWDGNSWINDEKKSYTYNTDGNTTSISEFYWDGSNWIQASTLEILTYNTHNDTISHTVYDSADGWGWKDSSVYNTANLKVEKYSLSCYSTIWSYSTKTEFSYNSTNQLSSRINYYWDGNTWIEDYKYDYFYNSSDLLYEQVISTAAGSTWLNNYKSIYNYDTNKNKISIYSYYWGSSWDIDNIDSFLYNNSSQLIVKANFSYWNGSSWDYIDGFKYGYDMDGNETSRTNYACSSNLCDSTYKSETLVTTSGGIHNEYLWVESLNAWWNYSKCEVNYNPFYATILEEPSHTNEIHIYPNPMHDLASVNVDHVINPSLILYDSYGRKIRSVPGNSGIIKIERLSLPSGIYFYQILSDLKVVGTNKLMIE